MLQSATGIILSSFVFHILLLRYILEFLPTGSVFISSCGNLLSGCSRNTCWLEPVIQDPRWFCRTSVVLVLWGQSHNGGDVTRDPGHDLTGLHLPQQL